MRQRIAVSEPGALQTAIDDKATSSNASVAGRREPGPARRWCPSRVARRRGRLLPRTLPRVETALDRSMFLVTTPSDQSSFARFRTDQPLINAASPRK